MSHLEHVTGNVKIIDCTTTVPEMVKELSEKALELAGIIEEGQHITQDEVATLLDASGVIDVIIMENDK